MKRAFKKRVKAVLKNTPSDDAPVEHLNVNNPKINRRVRTKAAMIGLAISMGATSLLVTRQSDQAQAAAPVGSQKATSAIPAAPDTKVKVKFASAKLESPAVSLASVPENPVIVEPTAVSQVPGLEAKWQIAASGMSVPVPASETLSKAVDKNLNYLQPQAVKGLSNTTVNQPEKNTSEATYPKTVAASGTISNDQVDVQLKAQQEFALYRLQEKSNRLRKSLAELRSGETKNLSKAGFELGQPTTVVEKNFIARSGTLSETNRENLISKLKQNREAGASFEQVTIPVPPATPTIVATSASTAYEVKPGDTLAAIANRYRTSIAELVKANNISNPNQLRISQKLVIPATKVRTNAARPTFAQPSSIPKVATPPVNTAGINLNLPAASQLPVIADNSSVNIPTSASAASQLQTGTTLPTTAPTVPSLYGVGGETPMPKAFAEMQLPRKAPQKVARARSARLQSLQAEIQRLQAKYRAQQSGNLVVPTANETNTAALQIPIPQPSNFVSSNSVSQRNRVAIPIAVPTPISSNYNAVLPPIKSEFRAIRPTSDEPVNPEFLPNQGGSQWTPSGNLPARRIATPPVGVNSSESLGRMRGTKVSPVPPLAAVDQYLPKPADEFTSPSPTSIVAFAWPAKGTLTSGYGWRWGRMHRGIDIANSTGTPIFSAANGVVEKAGWNKGGYGKLVDIRHPDGSLTRYGHNSRILVQVGQEVQQGQQIAEMGSTGFSTGPHSHFEIHPSGKGAVNPIAMLPERV
ncbi:MAG: peptidoglycan DD-metalloendopeptidase family protein [Desmonostoc vinosum HA7617-LM4]|nr:peptidoglycan DD-metalloendopeptidase family protein [Desmonostoc vinosum HA7617-LM4]